MEWLISSAQAQAASGAGSQQSAWSMFAFPLLLIAVFYFLLIRPQTKRAKEHRAMVAAIGVGSEVVTQGGILGKVTEVTEQFLTIEIADNVQVKVQRHTITQELPKGSIKSA